MRAAEFFAAGGLAITVAVTARASTAPVDLRAHVRGCGTACENFVLEKITRRLSRRERAKSMIYKALYVGV